MCFYDRKFKYVDPQSDHWTSVDVALFIFQIASHLH